MVLKSYELTIFFVIWKVVSEAKFQCHLFAQTICQVITVTVRINIGSFPVWFSCQTVESGAGIGACIYSQTLLELIELIEGVNVWVLPMLCLMFVQACIYILQPAHSEWHRCIIMGSVPLFNHTRHIYAATSTPHFENANILHNGTIQRTLNIFM